MKYLPECMKCVKCKYHFYSWQHLKFFKN